MRANEGLIVREGVYEVARVFKMLVHLPKICWKHWVVVCCSRNDENSATTFVNIGCFLKKNFANDFRIFWLTMMSGACKRCIVFIEHSKVCVLLVMLVSKANLSNVHVRKFVRCAPSFREDLEEWGKTSEDKEVYRKVKSGLMVFAVYGVITQVGIFFTGFYVSHALIFIV